MKRCAGSIAALLAVLGGVAHADDPRDLFGLGKTPPTEDDKIDCAQPETFGCALVTDPLDDASPFGLTTWLATPYLERLPVADSSYDSVAHYALGASRDEAGPVIGGATGLENRWTVEGAPVDSIRTGGAEMRLPLAFLQGITIGVGGFTAHQRVSTGGTIDATLVRGGDHHVVNARVYSGLSAAGRDRPIAPNTYSLRRLSVQSGPSVTTSVVATGPVGALAGGKVWYAAGIAPTLSVTDFTWQASRLVDLDHDGIPDGLPYPLLQGIATDKQNVTTYAVPLLARVGWSRGARSDKAGHHELDVTLVGHVASGARFLANATQQAAGVDRDEYAGSGIATFTTTWNRTKLVAQLSWQRSHRDESARNGAAANVPQFNAAYVPPTVADDPVVAQQCNDGVFPEINQCPIISGYYASAGAGALVDTISDRPTASASVTHATGHHVLRTGATLEDARLVQTTRYSGGELQRSLFDGHVDTAKFYNRECSEDPVGDCAYAESSALRYRTRSAAAYLEDTWSPEEGIRVDGGVRWEMMWVGPQLHFSKELAPRGGISWDFLGKGRSRAWASMGRTHAYLPAGLGETIIARDQIVHDITTGIGGHARSLETGRVYLVEDAEPMAQDEGTLGIEVGLVKTFRLVTWVQGRYLRRGLETTPDGFVNPGAKNGLPSRRSSEQLGIELATSPTAQLTLRVGYLAGRTNGNFPGPYDPQQGVTLYDGAELDEGYSTLSDMGRLPTSVGQRVFIEANRRGTFGVVTWQVGTRLLVANGKPRNVYADTDVGVISLIERGSNGRAPLLTQANVRVGASWRGFDLTLDVFNVFDRAQPTQIDDRYADGVVRPIDGGRYEDLVYLKGTDAQPAVRRSGYGIPFAYQSPVSAFLGLRHTF